MDEYIELLILAYFREYHEKYDLTDLKEKIGISYGMLDKYLDRLIYEQKLIYKDNLLHIAKRGSITLNSSELENYSYSQNLEDIYSINKWDPEAIYHVHAFSKKKWRGAEK